MVVHTAARDWLQVIDLGGQSFHSCPANWFQPAAIFDQITCNAGLSDLPLAKALKFLQMMLHTFRASMVKSAHFAQHCLIIDLQSINLAFNQRMLLLKRL